ncbi:MAG: DcaP family trimeric outer membrane transporter [Gammaproteobacteria bacterium]
MRKVLIGWTVGVTLICSLLMSFEARADQDMRELIVELTTQIKSLQKEVAQSNARIDELEKKLEAAGGETSASASSVTSSSAAIAPVDSPRSVTVANGPADIKPAVTAGDINGTFKVPGTDTSIGIGGFVKLDALYSSTGMGQDTKGNQRLEVAEIPIGPITEGDGNQLTFTGKESRFWFKSFTPSQWGDINTYLEMDFFGDARMANYTPRLRHAYGSIGNLLAGQTWTTFINSQAIANTLDNNNSVGVFSLLRQPQLRWTQPFRAGKLPMDWQFAVERAATRVWDTTLENPGTNTVYTSHYPDLVARLNFYPEWGNISLAAMGRYLQYAPVTTRNAHAQWVGAVSVAGKIDTVGPDNFRFMLNYGDALGRYAVTNFLADATINGAGDLEPLVSYGVMLAYQHWWDREWRSSIVYGYVRADQPAYLESANQDAHSLHANLLWSPVTQATLGLEYIYGNRELVNGQNGELHRLQFSTRFNF